MCDSALQSIYRSAIIAKLLHASSAWRGFASAMDKQRINAFLRRGLRSGLCPTDVSTFEELIDSQDEQLFHAIMANQSHVLHQLLPPLFDACLRYAPVHITDSYQITRLAFVSLILLIDYCTKTLTENVFYNFVLCINILIFYCNLIVCALHSDRGFNKRISYRMTSGHCLFEIINLLAVMVLSQVGRDKWAVVLVLLL